MDIFQKFSLGTFLKAGLGIGVVIVIALLYLYNNPSYPKFAFDNSKAEGWWSNGNLNLQKVAGADYQRKEPKDKLPVADLTMHHGEPNKSAADDNCFIMFSYFDYALDSMDSAHKAYEDKKSEQGTIKVLKPVTITVDTPEGNKEIEMRQYDFTIDDEKALSGYQIGFAPLDNGYMRIEGVCKEADDLKTLKNVMDAVKLEA